MNRIAVAKELVKVAKLLTGKAQRTKVTIEAVLEFDEDTPTGHDVVFEAQQAFLEGVPERYRLGKMKVELVDFRIVSGAVDKDGSAVKGA